jgi:hypothetical protein
VSSLCPVAERRDHGTDGGPQDGKQLWIHSKLLVSIGPVNEGVKTAMKQCCATRSSEIGASGQTAMT